MRGVAPRLIAIGTAVLLAELGVALGSSQAMPASLRPPSAQAQGSGGDAAAGREVFQASCAMCHGADAAGMMRMHPSLRGAVERLSPQGVEVTIRKGRATQPPMPAFEGRLTDAEITDVVAYIASLPVGPRNFGPDSGRDGGGMMGRDMMSERRRDWNPVAWAAVLVGILAVAALVFLALRRPRPAPAGEDPRLLLDRRYAAGELRREEYLERRRDLES